MKQRNNDISFKFVFILALAFGISSCDNNTSNTKTLAIEDGANIEQVIDSLIAEMTLEEKVGMIHANSSFTSAGVERLGIPELVMSDGPYGVRIEQGRGWTRIEGYDDAATYLPKGLCLSATWNKELGYAFGKVLGSEAKERGKDVILSPGVNIIRSPLNGRNFEYLSEDPYLNSRMAVGYINGVQDQGIAACVKHYVANNQEQFRHTVNVKMSERALHEIYLPAFKVSVEEAKVLTVMGAYNKFHGQFATHNKYLVNDILKTEWGFNGILISDWNAVHDTKEALLYGTDIEMGTDLKMLPNPDYNKFYLADSALAMIKSGKVEESFVDDKVRRILRVMFAINKFGKGTPGERNTTEHQQTALKIAEEGIVLLKNEKILPLKSGTIKSIAVIGDNAIHKHSMGGGSSQVNAKYEITILEGLKKALGDKVEIKFATGYKISKTNEIDEKLFNEAQKIAEAADLTIFVGGWIQNWTVSEWSDNVYDAEEVDKPNLIMPFGQDQLIQKVLKANPNTVVVLVGGGPVDMSLWINEVKGLIQVWYPGMEGGNALANIITGKVNPSGKLPMTFPKKLEDSPAHALGEFPGENGEVNYNEGIFVGYRYFDTYNVAPEFSFGHGLSYTSFEYNDLNIQKDSDKVKLSFFIKNIGETDGAEIAQIYIHDTKASVKRPIKELKAFEKVFLAVGESQLIEIELSDDAFSFYDETKKSWVLEPGEFKISVGSSSRDIRLSNIVEL